MAWLDSIWSFMNLPVQEAVERFYHGKSADWIAQFAPPEKLAKLDVGDSTAIEPDVHYVSVTAQKTVLAYDRVLLKTFYAAAHSTVVMSDSARQPRAITVFQTLSPDLLALDNKAGQKLVQGPRTLMDTVPFRGSAIGASIALLAVEAADYSKPLLSTLQKLSDIAGMQFFTLAAAYAEPLVLGIQGLSAAGGGVQVAYVGNLPLRTGVFLIAAIDQAAFDWASYSFSSDYSLLCDGIPVSDTSYMVLTVDVATSRPTWREIPELKAAEATLNAMVLAAKERIFDVDSDERKSVEGALANMQWECLNSPELCTQDGELIAKACKEKVLKFMSLANGGLTELRSTGRPSSQGLQLGFTLKDIHVSRS